MPRTIKKATRAKMEVKEMKNNEENNIKIGVEFDEEKIHELVDSFETIGQILPNITIKKLNIENLNITIYPSGILNGGDENAE